jgi:hypothetical protein
VSTEIAVANKAPATAAPTWHLFSIGRCHACGVHGCQQDTCTGPQLSSFQALALSTLAQPISCVFFAHYTRGVNVICLLIHTGLKLRRNEAQTVVGLLQDPKLERLQRFAASAWSCATLAGKASGLASSDASFDSSVTVLFTVERRAGAEKGSPASALYHYAILAAFSRLHFSHKS